MTDEGRCRFHCRTAREGYLAGYKRGVADAESEYLGIPVEEVVWGTEDEDAAKQAYREWRKGTEA